MILGLADIKDWLKRLDTKTVSEVCDMSTKELNESIMKQLTNKSLIADYFYVGKLDNKKEKSIGVYQLKRDNLPNIAIGGYANTKTMKKSISILIHWNKNAKETELKAYEIYYKLLCLRDFNINDVKVNYIELLNNEPIDVGTDENNVYERVVEATFYYENKGVK